MPEKIVFFDGLCNLCEASVKFIIKNDPENKFKFAALQSDLGQKLLSKLNQVSKNPQTLILIENKQIFVKSTAALKIAKELKGMWPAFYVFIYVPKTIRDFVYDLLARNRYFLFGKKASCTIPGKETKSRFISD